MEDICVIVRNLTKCTPKATDETYILYGPLLLIVAIPGLVGNSLVILVTARNRITSTGVLLISLAACDTIYLFFYMIFFMPIRLVNYVPTEFVIDFNIFIHRWMAVMNSTPRFCKALSVWAIVLVTLERLITVMKPLKAASILTPKRTLIAVACVVCFNLVFWSARYFVWVPYEQCHPCWGAWVQNRMDGRNPSMILHGWGVNFPFMVLYLLPMSILLVANPMIVTVLAQASRNRQKFSDQKKTDDGRMLLIVVLVFMMLETPGFMSYVNMTWLSVEVKIATFFGPINSSVNFIIYAVFGKKFRNDLTNLLICGRKTPNVFRSAENNNSSVTGTTDAS